MPIFNKDNKFDIQLSAAEIAEKRLADVLGGKKIELKTEEHLWEKTGNICIEYRNYGKPSGIAATEADFWAHELVKQGETLCYLIFPIEKLKERARAELKTGKRRGGDNHASEVVVIPLSQLFQ